MKKRVVCLGKQLLTPHPPPSYRRFGVFIAINHSGKPQKVKKMTGRKIAPGHLGKDFTPQVGNPEIDNSLFIKMLPLVLRKEL